jgi:hypothetical protein
VYKKIILILILSLYSFAELINNKEIDKEFFMLFIKKAKTIDDLKKDINDVEVFDYSIIKTSDNFELYLVNISTYEEILEYKKAFKNGVITKNFDNNSQNKIYNNNDNKKVKNLKI